MTDVLSFIFSEFPQDMPIMSFVFAVLSVYFAREFSRLSESIQDLNKNVAVLIERTTVQSHKIDRMEERVTYIEAKKKLS